MPSQSTSFPPEDDCDSQDRQLLGDDFPNAVTSDLEPTLSRTAANLDASSMYSITHNDHRSKHSEKGCSFPPSRRTGRRNFQCPNPLLLLSTLWVVTATSGIATALLVWIFFHRTQSGLLEIWREGAFLLDEGTHLEGGLPASRLMGLTIASASSIAMATVTPVLLSIYAHRSAHLWLKAGVAESLTPYQYGLMIESLGAAGIVSLSGTGNYLLRPSGRRRSAAYMLKEAFLVSVLAYVLAHAVGALDLWLHTTAATVTREVEVEGSESLRVGITQTMCASDPYPPTNSSGFVIPPCNLPSNPSILKDQAWDIITNISSVGVIFPANSSGIATLMMLNESIPTDAIFQIATFGARAECASFIPFCRQPDTDYISNPIEYIFPACEGGPSNFPQPISEDDVESPDPAGMLPIISFPSSATNNHMIDSFTDLIGYPSNITEPEPYALWLQFWFPFLNSIVPSDGPGVMAFGGGYGVALATCNVSYYNVTLEYRNGVHTMIDHLPTARFLSDGFSGVLRAGIYSDLLFSDLKPTFSAVNATEEERMALLTQEMTMSATASAGIIANVAAPPLVQYRDQTLGRYPIVPVLSLVALLYVNSAFAFGICILTATSRASRTKVPVTEGAMSVLDLARLRLTSPFALIADMCRLLDPNGERGSIETIDEDTFNDKSDKRRIRVGLQEDEVGKAVFRIWIERDDEVFTKGCDML